MMCAVAQGRRLVGLSAKSSAGDLDVRVRNSWEERAFQVWRAMEIPLPMRAPARREGTTRYMSAAGADEDRGRPCRPIRRRVRPNIAAGARNFGEVRPSSTKHECWEHALECEPRPADVGIVASAFDTRSGNRSLIRAPVPWLR